VTAPAPTLPTDTGVLGPGVLRIGPVGGELDVSCYLSQAGIPTNTTTGDSKKLLCGASRAGSTSTEFSLDVDIDLDLANESGLMAKSWSVADGGPNATQDFVFVPNNDLGVEISGQLVLTPLPMNKVAYGEDLVASVAWVIVGTPTLGYPAPAPDPTISTLAPATGTVGTQVTVTVTGTNFETGSTVEANQTALPTTFVSATSLTAPYTPTAAGTVQFTVRNPSGKESNDSPFNAATTATRGNTPEQ
jgi:hypothetical protein